MAIDNQIKVSMNVTSNGSTERELKQVKALKAAYDAAAASASGMGGTAGSRAVAAKAGSGMTSQEYGQLHGASGGTGASARDFANQAQGLGGLVRLYATYAANLFAVGAAFRALSSAMDTSNMVRGLDILGASSGRSLGSLSKRLVEVTDGALSLRESMEAVGKSASAGMSSKNIERMGMVAKNASIALGISMPDAISRLSRGITKLEPELLDELGLFTKIGPATDKYALEIGKTASQLTDFERRQAFANAVLEEGEQKFSAIAEASANPYDKLLSSLKNVGQSGLEVVNKVLGPAVELLSKSPTALGAGIVAVASLLVKQALPALGELRSGLERSAKIAGEAAIGKAGDAKRAREQLNRVIEAKVEQSAEAQLKIFEELEQKLYSTAAQGTTRRSALWKTLKKDIVDIEEADLLASEKSIKRLESAARADASKKPQAELERQTFEELKKVIAAEDNLVNIKKQNRQIEEDRLKATGTYARVQQAAADYEESARKKAIVSNAAYNTSLLGMRNAWILMKEDIAASGLKLDLFGKGLLMARAGVASLATAVGVLGSVINKAFLVFSTIAAVFGALDAVLSTNSKQAQKFASSIDAAESSAANLGRTLEAARNKQGIGTQSIDNTIAFSTALTEATDSMKQATDAFDKLEKASGGWDKFWDGVFSFFGKGAKDKLAATMAEQISGSFKLLQREGLETEFQKSISSILKVQDLTDVEAVEKAYKSLSKSQRDAIDNISEAAKNKLGNVASILQSFKDSTDQASKSYKEYLQSLGDTNPLVKLGKSLQDAGIAMMKLSGEGTLRLAQAFEDLSKNTDKAIALLGPDGAKEFVEIRQQFDAQKQAIDATTSALAKYRLEMVKAARSGATSVTGTGPTSSIARGQQALLTGSAGSAQPTSYDNASEMVRLLSKAAANQTTDALDKAKTFLAERAKDIFDKGTALITRAAEEARISAGLVKEKALTGDLTGAEKARADLDIQKRQLDLQISTLDSNIQVAKGQAAMRVQLEIANSLQEENNALLKLQLNKDDKTAKTQLDSAKENTRFLRAVAGGSTEGFTDEAKQAALMQRKSLEDLAVAPLTNQRTKLLGERAALNITGKKAISEGELATQKALDDLQLRRNQALQAQLDIQDSIASTTNLELINSKIKQTNDDLAIKQADELKGITEKLARLEDNKLQAKGSTLAEIEKEIKKTKDLKTATEEAQKAERDAKGAQDAQRLLTAELANISKKYELSKSQADLDKTVRTAALDSQTQELALVSSAYDMAKEVVIVKQAALEQDKLSLETTYAKQQAESALAQKREEAEARIKALGGDRQSARAKEILDELARQETLTRNTLAGLDAQYASKSALLEKTKEINLEQEKYNQLLSTAAGLAESLKETFGDLGEKLGNVATSFAQMAINSDKRAKSEAAASKAVEDAFDKASLTGNLDDLKSKEDALAKIRKKNAKEQLNDDIKAVSSTKKLFSEKTGAYKLLDSMEKAMHVQKMAMFAAEVAADLWKTGTAIVNSINRTAATETEAAAAGTAAVVEQGKGDPYTAFARMAAMAAFVAAILGSSASNASVPSGITAEQRQKVQGTAMGYDASGNLVQTSRGVFGDTEAKTASIANSLEIIRDNSVKGLDYDDKMLRAFTNLTNSLDTTAKGLYAITGLKAGSLSGVVEGTNTSGGFLGIGGLFSTSTTKSITDSGLQLKGTFLDLVKGVKGTINTFEVVQTTVKKSGFLGIGGSTSTSVSTTFKDLSGIDPKAFKSLVASFQYAQDVLVQVANIANISQKDVESAMAKVNIDQMASLRGLTGEEFTKELGTVIGSILDETSLVIFSQYEKFAKFGEGMLETVTRVIDGNKKVLQQLRNTFNSSLEDTLSIYGVIPAYQEKVSYVLDRSKATKDELLKAADILGDSSKLTVPRGWSRFFYNVDSALAQAANNLTEADLKKLNEAGISFATKVVTVVKDGVSRSFSAADIGFATIEITNNLVDLAGGIQNFVDQSNYYLDNFLTSAQRAVPTQKAVIKQLNALGYASVDTKAEFKALVESLDLTQPEVRKTYQALMDLAPGFIEVLDAATEQTSGLKDAASGLRDFSKQVSDFISSLKLGSSSILTPAEKYAEARRQFEEVYDQAMAGDKTALGKVTSSAQSFLDASKTLYASSEAYTLDFNTVLSKLEQAGANADSAATIAEQQLSTLSIHTDLLSEINSNIALIAGVPTRASGGRAKGLTLVGELGPELVDFNTPGRVYTAAQTEGMFALPTQNNTQQQLLTEVANLRQEVVKLREQQRTETGHLINATYDAQNRNAEAVTDGVDASLTKQAWADRVRQNAVIG